MTLNVGKVYAVTDGNLGYSNITETEYSQWLVGTPYIIGDRVLSTSSHNVFECILGHTGKNPNTAANIGVYWVLVSKTNRWRAFDLSISNKTSTTEDSIQYRVEPGSNVLNGIVLLGVDAARSIVTRLTPAATVNFAPQSEGFANASYWTAANLTPTFGVTQDPFGMYQADRCLEVAIAAVKTLTAIDTRSYTSGNTYTISIYARRISTGADRNVRLTMPSAAFGASVYGNFTLSGTGTAVAVGGATVAISQITASWYRCSVTAVASANVSSIMGTITILDAAMTTGYLGVTSTGLSLFGFQNNNGALAAYQVAFVGTRYTRTYLDSYTWGQVGGTDYDLLIEDRIIYSPGAPLDEYEICLVRDASVSEVAIGEIVLIPSDVRELGELVEPTENSFLDFSVKTRDDFGNISLIQRNYADDTNYTFVINTADVNVIRTIIRNRRGEALVFWDDADPDNALGLLTYGFINGYSINIPGATTTFVSLDTEGLS